MRLSIRLLVGMFVVCFVFGAVFVASAGPDTPEARGRILFEDTEDFLYPSCAHCHSVTPDKEEKKLKHIGPGHSLWGSAKRGGWRNMKTYKNVGAALVNAAIDAARARGCQEIGLYSRETTRAFYEKLGFRYAGPEVRLPLKE